MLQNFLAFLISSNFCCVVEILYRIWLGIVMMEDNAVSPVDYFNGLLSSCYLFAIITINSFTTKL